MQNMNMQMLQIILSEAKVILGCDWDTLGLMIIITELEEMDSHDSWYCTSTL